MAWGREVRKSSQSQYSLKAEPRDSPATLGVRNGRKRWGKDDSLACLESTDSIQKIGKTGGKESLGGKIRSLSLDTLNSICVFYIQREFSSRQLV